MDVLAVIICIRILLIRIIFAKEGSIMSRFSRFLQISLIGTILFGFLAAWRRRSKSGARDTVIQHTVDKRANDVLAYWTPDKMRQAEGARMPHVPAPDQNKDRPHTSRS